MTDNSKGHKWVKGQSGNPRGSKPEKLIREAISVALNEKVKIKDGDNNVQTVKRLRLVADRLVKEAIDGNVAAIKEIADRMDGKAPQLHDHDHQHHHQHESVSETTRFIEEVLGARPNGEDKKPLPH